jgi:hypothetical protein
MISRQLTVAVAQARIFAELQTLAAPRTAERSLRGPL